MAKKRTTAAKTQIIRMPSAPAPIIRVAAPRAAPKPKRRPGKRRGGGGGGIVSQNNIDMAIGGAFVGFAVKNGYIDKLPAIPVLGRIGTAAILLDMYSKRGGHPMAARAATACAVLAGYQLMSQGKIDGDEDEGSATVVNDEDDDG